MSGAILDAAYHVVHDYQGGAESLAPRLKKSYTTLCHEVTATGSAKLGLLDAVKITDFSGNLSILRAWATHAGQQLVPLPIVGDPSDECLVRVATMAREFGELVTEVTSDLGDGSISDNEMGRIQREAGELIGAVHQLLGALQQRNLMSKPPRERQVP